MNAKKVLSDTNTFFYEFIVFLKFMFNFANGFNYIHYLDNARHTNLR